MNKEKEKQNKRFLVPSIVIETIKKDKSFFGFSENRLCNEVLFKCFPFVINEEEGIFSDFSLDMLESKEFIQFSLHVGNIERYLHLVISYNIGHEAEFLRKVFSLYSSLQPFLRERILFREKIYFLKRSWKDKTKLRISTPNGFEEGIIEDILIEASTKHLQIQVNKKRYYLANVII